MPNSAQQELNDTDQIVFMVSSLKILLHFFVKLP